MNDSYTKKVKEAAVSFANGILEVSNGKLRRKWRLTDNGLLTTEVNDLSSGRVWTNLQSDFACDWELPGFDQAAGKLISVYAEDSDDEGFTSGHLKVECHFSYEQIKIELIYIIWLYYDYAGMRTQFKIKSASDLENGNWTQQGKPAPARMECLPVNPGSLTRRYFGYYSDTQNRNDPFLDILKEAKTVNKKVYPEWITWANAICLEDDHQGIAMVKESHKCVNHPGHDSGMFIVDPNNGLLNLGWGIYPNEICDGKYSESWASWLFCWDKSVSDRQTAFKSFDRLRYPVNIERDTYIQANTWGSTSSTATARAAAHEDSVLREIECCAELGIDILQIDDGWQPSDYSAWYPTETAYPEGWKNVVQAAKENNVKLGLWAAAEPVALEDLLRNREQGGFVQYKLDFAHLDSRSKLDNLMAKARKFILSTEHQTRVNWDLTEINPRYGYFFAREYGTIYLENRKPVSPWSAIYRPDTVLRDLWQISKYVDLCKFQASYQNIDMVNPAMSNAKYYTHAYCFAITMMGTPLFFLETKYLSESAKAELRPVIKAYKAVQKDIFSGITYPIGDKPDDASWTGFQNHNHQSGDGYLTVFRELNNEKTEASLALRYLSPGSELKLKNMLTNEVQVLALSANGKISLNIPEAPGFLFLKYETP